MTHVHPTRAFPLQRFVLVDEDGMPWLSTLVGVSAEGYAFHVDEIDAEIILPEETLEDMFDSSAAFEIPGVRS